MNRESRSRRSKRPPRSCLRGAAAWVILGAISSHAPPAAALDPLDDFEIGSFSFQSSSDYEVHEVILNPASPHAMWWKREITLEPEDALVRASLVPGSALDDAMVVRVEGDGRCRVGYDWGFPVDLTFGGTVDRIEMEIHAGVPGAEVYAGITDVDSGSFGTQWLGSTNPQILSWEFSSWVGGPTDITQATGIVFLFSAPPTAGDYVVADIRFHSTGSYGVSFVGDFVATQVPPIPSPPLRFRSIDPTGHPIYRADVAIQDAYAGFVPTLNARWQDTPGLGGEIAGMQFFWGSPDLSYQSTALEISVELASANGWTPEILFPPDPIHGDTDLGFLLAFPVLIREPSGVPVGVSHARLLFDVGAGQPLKFQGVQVAPGGAAVGGPNKFTVAFSLAATGNVNEGAPLLDATWLADWDPAPASTGVTAAPSEGSASLTLFAWPSVTRGATDFRANAPLRASSTISIHDVTGRFVRSLAWPAGTPSVRWDGTSAAGTPVTAGVYFARLAAIRGAPARVVQVR